MTDDPALKLQLIELYILLKQYDNAEKLISVEIELEKNKKLDDITGLKYRTKLLLLLADVQEKVGNAKAAQNTLKEARDNQNRLRKLFVMEQTGEFSNIITDIKLTRYFGFSNATRRN